MSGSDLYGERRPTEREYAIIALVALGLKNGDVARTIGTTQHVIKNRLRTIYDKLGVWNRVELALWYEARRNDDRPAAQRRAKGSGHPPLATDDPCQAQGVTPEFGRS